MATTRADADQLRAATAAGRPRLRHPDNPALAASAHVKGNRRPDTLFCRPPRILTPRAAPATGGETMTIAVGDRIPDVEIWTTGNDDPRDSPDRRRPRQGHRRAVRGPRRLHSHLLRLSPSRLPRPVRRPAGERRRHHRVCVGQRPVRHGRLEADQGVGKTIVMLADGNGVFTREMGLETRQERGRPRSALAAVRGRHQGRSRHGLMVEPGGGLSVSSADAVLAALVASLTASRTERLRAE